MTIENTDDRKIALDKLFKSLSKEFGESVKLPGAETPQINRFSSGCETLNRVLGGGYPEGRIVEIYGPASAGKTSLAILACAQVQKAGDTVAYLDTEHSLDSAWCSQLGFDLKKAIFSQPDTGEQGIDILAAVINSGAVKLVVVDSVASLTPMAEMEASAEQNHMALQARMLSKAMRRIAGPASKNGCTVILLNQLRSNLGSYGSPDITSGGQAIRYFASIRLDVRRASEPLKEKDLIVGHTIRVKAAKNKTAAPFATGEFAFYYGNNELGSFGIDYVADLVDSALIAGIIERGGAWFKYQDEKFQGKLNLVNWFKADVEKIQELKEKVNSKVTLIFDLPSVNE